MMVQVVRRLFAAVGLGATLLMVLISARVMALEALVLEYSEWEQGGDPYAARVLISPEFVRFDFGSDDVDFALLDRRAGVVYAVQTDDQRVMEVAAPIEKIRADMAAEVAEDPGAARSSVAGEDAGGVAAATMIETQGNPPRKLRLTQSSRIDKDAPSIGGEQPLITDFGVNGSVCMQTVSVPGLLPEAVTAWREFALIMANQRASTLANTPQEYWQDCSLANDIYAPVRYLRHGLPVREHSRSGVSRELLGFDRAASLPDDIFTLPKGFRRYRFGNRPDDQSGDQSGAPSSDHPGQSSGDSLTPQPAQQPNG